MAVRWDIVLAPMMESIFPREWLNELRLLKVNWNTQNLGKQKRVPGALPSSRPGLVLRPPTYVVTGAAELVLMLFIRLQ